MPLWTKLAFFLGDALLLGVALVIVLEAPRPLPLSQALLLTAAVLNGAVLFVIPFILEYKASVRLSEALHLRGVADRFRGLEQVQEQIRFATSQWQTVQELCDKTVTSARTLSEQVSEERKAIVEIGEKTIDAERAHLRLEVDKFRRSEEEWIEAVVRICDHVYALYRAAIESGQPALREQLGLFQRAVRETVRRVGLVPHDAIPDEPFDPRKHQLPDGTGQPPQGSLVASTVATGFTYQGQPIRRIVVTLRPGVAGPGDDAGVRELDSGGLKVMPKPEAAADASSAPL